MHSVERAQEIGRVTVEGVGDGRMQLGVAEVDYYRWLL